MHEKEAKQISVTKLITKARHKNDNLKQLKTPTQYKSKRLKLNKTSQRVSKGCSQFGNKTHN